jgi:chemotaxis signal transduction protein
MTITADRPNPSEEQTSLLENRFILTQVRNSTLVFPAIWVTEILRIDRSHLLTLPFYNPLILGIVDRNGQTIPLVDTARMLGLVQETVPERVLIVRLNETAEGLKNVGLIIDRLIGNTTRSELPSEIFTIHHSGDLVMMQSDLISADLWVPQN